MNTDWLLAWCRQSVVVQCWKIGRKLKSMGECRIWSILSPFYMHMAWACKAEKDRRERQGLGAISAVCTYYYPKRAPPISSNLFSILARFSSCSQVQHLQYTNVYLVVSSFHTKFLVSIIDHGKRSAPVHDIYAISGSPFLRFDNDASESYLSLSWWISLLCL